MKKYLLTGALAGGLLLSACSSDDASSDYAVKSDLGNITKDEFYEELVENDNGNLLQQLILEMVLSEKFSVDEKELDERFENFKAQYEENFEMVLMQQGYSGEEEFREALKMSMLYEEAIFEDVEVTEDEIEEAYERMKEEIHARHILVDSEELAAKALEDLENGDDFEDVASQYSIDPGTAQEGGDLGYFTALDMVKEFEDAAYSLDIDEISEPVESSNGFHIIQVLDKRENEDLLEFDEMSDEILSKIRNTKVSDEEANEIIDQILIDANLDIKVKGFEDLFHFDDIDTDSETDSE